MLETVAFICKLVYFLNSVEGDVQVIQIRKTYQILYLADLICLQIQDS